VCILLYWLGVVLFRRRGRLYLGVGARINILGKCIFPVFILGAVLVCILGVFVRYSDVPSAGLLVFGVLWFVVYSGAIVIGLVFSVQEHYLCVYWFICLD
jgi:hypothetical protein